MWIAGWPRNAKSWDKVNIKLDNILSSKILKLVYVTDLVAGRDATQSEKREIMNEAKSVKR